MAVLLMGILAVIEPVDGAAEVLLVGTLAAVVGFVVGASAGRRQRQFLPLRGCGPRVSQSMRAQPEPVYASYDTTAERFELTEHAVATVALNALSAAPFVRPDASEELRRAPQLDECCAAWVFHTHDSAGRPIFLDEGGILAMLAFATPRVDSDALHRALERVADRGVDRRSREPMSPARRASPSSESEV